MLLKVGGTHFPTWHYPGRFDGYDLSLFSSTVCQFGSSAVHFWSMTDGLPNWQTDELNGTPNEMCGKGIKTASGTENPFGIAVVTEIRLQVSLNQLS